MMLDPSERALIPTGFAVGIPDGMVGLVCSRSGLALKKGIFVLNAPGIIDSDYRGMLGIVLANFSPEPFHIEFGDRIAQLVVTPFVGTQAEEVIEIGNTERGAGGFGSSGR